MTAYTASQLIKCEIIARGIDFNKGALIGTLAENFPEAFQADDTKGAILNKLTHENIDEVYAEVEHDDAVYTARNEMRQGEEKTNLDPTVTSRHYEIDSVAQCILGKWVEWPYLYGAGKHSEPEAYDWVSAARFLDCQEEEVTVIKRTFSVQGEENAA
ncbi:hypothetical protein ACEPOF_000411 [Acinetobacter baumannii]